MYSEICGYVVLPSPEPFPHLTPLPGHSSGSPEVPVLTTPAGGRASPGTYQRLPPFGHRPPAARSRGLLGYGSSPYIIRLYQGMFLVSMIGTSGVNNLDYISTKIEFYINTNHAQTINQFINPRLFCPESILAGPVRPHRVGCTDVY